MIPGVTLLVFTKIADMCTTAVGLLYIPGITELNPIASAVFHEFGTVTGVVVFGGVVVFAVAIVVELGACELYRWTGSPTWPVLLRGGAYGSVSFVYAAAAYQNAVLIANHVHLGLLF